FRNARLRELTRLEDTGAGPNLVQDRRHYLSATFQPIVVKASPLKGLFQEFSARFGTWVRRGSSPHGRGRWETTYDALLDEAARFARRVEVGLSQMGLGYRRCRTSEIVACVYELLNPTSSGMIEVDSLSERARLERDRLPRSIVDDVPFAADTSPVW